MYEEAVENNENDAAKAAAKAAYEMAAAAAKAAAKAAYDKVVADKKAAEKAAAGQQQQVMDHHRCL